MLELKNKMKKLFLFSALMLLTSCAGMGCYPSEYEQNEAISYYNSFGTSSSDISHEEAEKYFSCYDVMTDKIYSYNTFFGEKLILVRRGKALTYVDRK